VCETVRVCLSLHCASLGRDGRQDEWRTTKPTKSSVAALISALTDETKRAEAETLVKVMQRATGES
jgi:hypothetical protein